MKPELCGGKWRVLRGRRLISIFCVCKQKIENWVVFLSYSADYNWRRNIKIVFICIWKWKKIALPFSLPLYPFFGHIVRILKLLAHKLFICDNLVWLPIFHANHMSVFKWPKFNTNKQRFRSKKEDFFSFFFWK